MHMAKGPFSGCGNHIFCIPSIGLAIARRLGQDGAKVMVSSRKQANVDRTVLELKSENLAVEGMVCHVGKAEDRTSLIKEVGTTEVLDLP